jgi:hypothetical protein
MFALRRRVERFEPFFGKISWFWRDLSGLVGGWVSFSKDFEPKRFS